MIRKTKAQFISGIILMAVFILYTVSLSFVDVQPIGPQGSYVAYAGINKAVQEFFGFHTMLYTATGLANRVVMLFVYGFAALGIVQWVKRKSLLRVDSSILVLGVFYILVFAVYMFFEIHIVNYRPVLMHGVLEASYPSSTTLRAACVMPTAMMQFRRLIQNRRIGNAVNALCGLFTAFLLIGRLVCGVHWFTDILGGWIFSAAMVLLYCAANNWILWKKNRLEEDGSDAENTEENPAS